MKYVVLLTAALLAGCATAQPATNDQHARSRDGDEVIADPYDWVSQRFEMVTHETVNGIERVWLQEARGDINFDGTLELFVGNGPARCWGAAVFTPVEGGYRYIGEIGGRAFRILPKDEKGRPRMLVYEPCGGHYGYIVTYMHDGKEFVCTSREGIHGGDGAPDENNRRLDELFFSGSAKNACLKWRKR